MSDLNGEFPDVDAMAKEARERLKEAIDSGSAFPSDVGWSSLYSAFGIGPRTPLRDVDRTELFSYGPCRPVTLWPDPVANAGREHTNIPRAGQTGLPKDWQFLAMRWRARINEPLVPEVLDYLAATTAEFRCNDRRYETTSLLDLVHAPQAIGNILVREHLPFSVVLQCDRHLVIDNLKRYLSRGSNRTPIYSDEFSERLWALRDALALVQQPLDDQRVAIGNEAVVHLDRKLRELSQAVGGSRTLIGWVYLEGPLQRCVI